MMILPEKKVAFVHIYKTGGTSLTQLLAPFTSPQFRAKEPRTSGDGFQGTWHFKNVQHSRFNHPSQGFPAIIADQVADYQFITVVRNPYTWCHSVYREFFADDRNDIRGSNFLFGQVKPGRSMRDFYDFVETFQPGYRELMGLATQFDFVEGIAPEQLHMIRFENYEEDVRKVLPQFDIPVEALPHALDRGEKKRLEAQQLMNDPWHVDFCNRVYAKDFEKFGYEALTLVPVDGV